MRQTTERPEGIAAGNARLVGTCRNSIVSHLLQLLDDPRQRAAMSQVQNPYGDGTAAKRIVAALIPSPTGSLLSQY